MPNAWYLTRTDKKRLAYPLLVLTFPCGVTWSVRQTRRTVAWTGSTLQLSPRVLRNWSVNAWSSVVRSHCKAISVYCRTERLGNVSYAMVDLVDTSVDGCTILHCLILRLGNWQRRTHAACVSVSADDNVHPGVGTSRELIDQSNVYAQGIKCS